MTETIYDIILYGFAIFGVIMALIIGITARVMYTDRTWDNVQNSEAICESDLYQRAKAEITDTL